MQLQNPSDMVLALNNYYMWCGGNATAQPNSRRPYYSGITTASIAEEMTASYLG
jgi:hypothetical protein